MRISDGDAVKQSQERVALLTTPCGGFAAVALLHLLVAFLYVRFAGVRPPAVSLADLDEAWHLLPVDALRFRFLESIWHLHAQPPLFNAWYAVFFKLFYPDPLPAMHAAYCILGALLSGMVYLILLRLLSPAWLALCVSAALALNPSLFLFEAYPHYDIPVAFLLTCTVFLVTLLSSRKRPVYAYGVAACLNVLILTRSMFHPVLLVPAMGVVCALSGTQWRRVLVVAALISLTSLGWYGKNWVLFGFFGGSSWMGQNLWTIACANYDRPGLNALAAEGTVEDHVVGIRVWSRPSAYRNAGFDKVSEVDVLARDDHNNINIIAISRMYQRNALALIGRHPLHYAMNVAAAYRIFSAPSSQFNHFADNAARLGVHEWVWSQCLQGQAVTAPTERLVGRDYFKSLWFFVLPAVGVGFLVAIWRTCGLSPSQWLGYVRSDGVMVFMGLMIAYVTAVSCTFDYGENERFKFVVEPLIWLFVFVVASRGFGWWLHRQDKARQDTP